MRAEPKRLPDFLVIGAEKGGTTWLYSVLKEMPDVYLPETKEIHFFNRYSSNLEEIDRFTRLGLDWYARYFEPCPRGQLAGEVTPMYLCDPDAPRRIAETLPAARLIASLRNPIDRAYSHYWMAYRKGHCRDSFEEVVANRDPRFIERGLYGAQIDRYLALFPAEHLLTLIFEDLVVRPVEDLRVVREFLGLAPEADVPLEKEPVHGASRYRSAALHTSLRRMARWMSERPRLAAVTRTAKRIGMKKLIDGMNTVEEPYPPMPEPIRRALTEFYAPDMALLEARIGRRIDAWRTTGAE